MKTAMEFVGDAIILALLVFVLDLVIELLFDIDVVWCIKKTISDIYRKIMGGGKGKENGE